LNLKLILHTKKLCGLILFKQINIIILMNFDITFSQTYSPQNNFYMWVNHDWIDNNPIPADHQRWSSFNVLDLENKMKIKNILEQKHDNKFNALNILYNQGLDTSRINDEVYQYLQPIQNAQTIDDLLKVMVDYKLSNNLGGPVALYVFNDFDNANMNILHLYTSGLGLPDRDYYFDSSHMKEREEYTKFITTYTDLFNLNVKAEAIYKIEEFIAEYTFTKVQKRQPELQNNPRTLNEIITEYPSFKFLNYFFNQLNKTPGKINLSNPNFFKKIDGLFNTEPLQNWKDYFMFKFLLSVNSYLSPKVEETYFNFYCKFLSGTPTMKPLWKRAVANTESQLGFLIGQKFVQDNFSEKAKKQALELVMYLKLYLKEEIIKLDWMGETTKIKALEKLNTMVVKIGYPDKWREYKSEITINNSYLKNNMNCNKDDNMFEFNKLYEKIDRTEWGMFPQEVNAYYSPSTNEIVFPAGILQAPFFSETYEPALNFGGIGSVIGHEMTHGFDDQGSKFDAEGNLKNWWTENDFNNYRLKTNVIKQQYSEYTINNMKINGELTLGENIADIGGVAIALGAFKKYLEENGNYDNYELLLQRFFINYSKIWRSNSRDEDMKIRILTDPHSPPIFRVNGVLKNINDFYKIFNLSTNSELYLPEELRAKIW